ncbi:MAG TPA: hypothetical protein VFO23_07465, partial [Steroidobacteraceae bacterium]|nr:hypothetical protein [Steroidobacteraceae bacterium]
HGVPVPITGADTGLEQVLAAAARVQNVLPEGSTWDGKSDLPMDEGSFKQMLSEIEPDNGSADAPAATSAPPAPAGGGAAAPKPDPTPPKKGS